MKPILIAASVVGLVLVIVPPVLYFVARMDKGSMQALMLAGTLLWFASVPFWMGRSKP